MLLEQTHDKLIAMKLFGMAAALKERLARRDHQDLSKPEFFGLLVDDEWLYRENRKLTARLKLAKFKQRSAAIENIDYSTPRGLRKDQVLELAQNRWIKAHESSDDVQIGVDTRSFGNAECHWRRGPTISSAVSIVG